MKRIIYLKMTIDCDEFDQFQLSSNSKEYSKIATDNEIIEASGINDFIGIGVAIEQIDSKRILPLD